MDSVSQIVLGASIAHLTLGERLGKRALILGAVLGTLPDLDVLVPYADAVESFTYHRSWSHSIFVLSTISFPIAWLVQRLFKNTTLPFNRYLLGVWLILFTHPLLDSFTTYGTQILWPLMPPPTALGSVFIIDPLYTVPLIIAVVIAWRRSFIRSKRITITALGFSSVYLLWTLIAQHTVYQKLEQTLTQLDIEAQSILVAPFPLSLLWRTVVQSDNHYYEGYSSLLDSKPSIDLSRYDNGKTDCGQWLTHWPVQRLDWFTRGQFALSVEGNDLIASDLRIGVEGSYIFRFAVAGKADDTWQVIQTRQLPVDIDTSRMRLLMKRAVDESIELAPITLASNTHCQINVESS